MSLRSDPIHFSSSEVIRNVRITEPVECAEAATSGESAVVAVKRSKSVFRSGLQRLSGTGMLIAFVLFGLTLKVGFRFAYQAHATERKPR